MASVGILIVVLTFSGKVGVSVFAPLSDITPGALRPPPWATLVIALSH